MEHKATVNTGDRSYLPATADLYVEAFRKDPLVNYFTNSVSDEKREQLRPHVFKLFLELGALNEAVYYHATVDDAAAGDGCRAMIMKPGKSIDGTITALRAFFRGSMSLIALGPSAIYRVLVDCEGQVHQLRRKTFKKGQTFWYVASIATDKADRGKKLAHAVIRDLQNEARRTKHPIWLEASTPYSQGVYASLGFETVEVFRCGKGSVGTDGFRRKRGEGVPVAAMVWWGDSSLP